jgi:hypothetical protein
MRQIGVLLMLSFLIYSGLAQTAGDHIPLSSVGVYRSTFDKVNYNTSSEMKMGNILYQEGIQLFSPFYSSKKQHDAYFNLDRSYNRLTGLLGIDDKSQFSSFYKGMTLTLLGDDKELQKVTFVNGDLPVSVDLDVSGVRRLSLDATYQEESGWDATENIYIDFVNTALWKLPQP